MAGNEMSGPGRLERRGDLPATIHHERTTRREPAAASLPRHPAALPHEPPAPRARRQPADLADDLHRLEPTVRIRLWDGRQQAPSIRMLRSGEELLYGC